jgi:trans-aconitate methyltransferase
MSTDTWDTGTAYEPFVGRWSRLVAREFLSWLAVPAVRRWLDVGCGTGALSQTILQLAQPSTVQGIDRSETYVAFAREHIVDSRASFAVGDAENLQEDASSYDVVVSGLVLNFVPDHKRAVSEMRRVTSPQGVVAAYVWDYADQMQLMRYFWDAAVALNPDALELDEGRRFPVCKPEPLKDLFLSAGLGKVDVRPIDIPTHFMDFDDYWSPFLGGQGPAPSYAMSLNDAARSRLKEHIQAKLPIQLDGTIPLMARAWAVKGIH